MTYSRIHLILLESGLLRGKEWSSLLVLAPITLLLPHLTFQPLYFSTLSIFFLIPMFPLFFLMFFRFFSFLLFLSLVFLLFFTCLPLLFFFPLVTFISPPVTAIHCAQLRPFYTTCRDEFYYFTLQLLLAWCRCSKTTHQSVSYSTITTTLC